MNKRVEQARRFRAFLIYWWNVSIELVKLIHPRCKRKYCVTCARLFGMGVKESNAVNIMPREGFFGILDSRIRRKT